MSEPLVSVIILTYNSSKFIIDALTSVYNQTWKNIELIIGDDCSKDNTVPICSAWISRHESRFTRVELITSPINTGVSENLNRAIAVANGKWIKGLAGDDILFQECVADNIAYVERNPMVKVLFSQAKIFRDTFDASNHVATVPGIINENSILCPERTALSQHRLLLLSDRIHFTPSLFILKDTLDEVGGYNSQYKSLEDYPQWLKLTKNGIKLFYMAKVTVGYRQHSEALNNKGGAFLVNPNYFQQESFRKANTYPYLPLDVRLLQQFKWFASQVFRLKWLNKDLPRNRMLLRILTDYLNPFRYIIWLRKQFSDNIKNNDFYS